MSIYKKLFEAKKEIGKISKDSTNPFFKSKYFDINSLLEHVEPILQKHELLLLQPIVNNKQQTVIIDIETGEKEISEIELSDIKDPQKKGSEITYFRRYTAQNILGLQAEDDDGNKAVKAQESQVKAKLKTIKTKEELRTFYANLQEPIKTNLKTLITEFSLTLDK